MINIAPRLPIVKPSGMKMRVSAIFYDDCVSFRPGAGPTGSSTIVLR